MKIKKYIVQISTLSLILLSAGTMMYKSLADEIWLNQDDAEENFVDGDIVGSEEADENKETENIEDVVVDSDEGVSTEEDDSEEKDEVVKEDEVQENENKEPVDSEKKEEAAVKATVSIDKTLPKLVGVDVTKKNTQKEDLPILPGFTKVDVEDGYEDVEIYECKTNNAYDTVIRMYKTTEKNGEGKVIEKVMVRTGFEVTEDKMLQSIVSVILDYYKNKKWEFIYNGNESYFEIYL